MPQSLPNIILHIIFRTKDRAPLIPRTTAPDVYRYLAFISQAQGCPAHKIGGTKDHVQMCCFLARTQTCARPVAEIRTGSSRWMKTQAPSAAGFSWQNGYGAFSVGESQIEALEELRELRKRYGTSDDERDVWD